MTLSGAASKTTTTDLGGNYTFAGLVNGTYAITPSKAATTFTPASRLVTINASNITGRNFAATRLRLR
jgi:hypothetical protein